MSSTVNKPLVRRKLGLIAEELGRLLSFRDVSLEELLGDFIRQAAVERILERIINRAIDINEHLIAELATGEEDRITRLTYRDTFLMLADLGVYPRAFGESVARSVGLRNVLVHEYNTVDPAQVHSSIRSCLRDYERYIRYVEAFVERLPEP
ncbi:MAG: hypothetical protein KatS3mg131_1951 [Candidatus Tectimicrobiota bacterium]|nr:MAG: hypothetical protein KatS3mg131_1951 [Candidatus Tectomicrobia bacterium]